MKRHSELHRDSRSRPGSAPRWQLALLMLGLPWLACAREPATSPPSNALAPCVSIDDDGERLACYDRLAGRTAARAAPGTPAAPNAPTAPPAPPAPPAAAAAAPPAPVPAPAPAPAPAAPSSAASPASPPASSFGLYAAEHPKPKSQQIEGRVAFLGQSTDGRATVGLQGGAVWELLDEADPLLRVGDAVTIKRAALGSYLMSTPTRRTHRVQRLR